MTENKIIKRSSISFLKSQFSNIVKVLITLINGICLHLFEKQPLINKQTAANKIFILGANLVNKGAMAMALTVVDQIRRNGYTNKIYLMSSKDYNKKNSIGDKYNFDILPWDINIKLLIISPLFRFIFRNKKTKKFSDILIDLIREGRFFVDISGYALSTQWGLIKSIDYILNIIISVRFNIDFLILPQSIGPFKYPKKIILGPLLKLYMKYPKKIYIRERDGIESIKPYANKNCILSPDIVLMNKSFELSNIFRKKIKLSKIKLENNPVCVIPNLKIAETLGYKKTVLLYRIIILALIKNKIKHVYILTHSTRDATLSKNIKRTLPSDKNIYIIDKDLNPLELEFIIKQSDFIIASRYHSIIHAYKNGIPAIIIGWALKYHELALNFNQLQYFYDCRNAIGLKDLDRVILEMLKNFKKEKRIIYENLKIFQTNSIFNEIFINLKSIEKP